MFYGIQRTTLVDFPKKIAATLFTGGCNFRCPWCHNQDLVYPERLTKLSPLPETEVKVFLLKRKKYLEGVCVTGGEPTLWGERLLNFLEWAKSIGYQTKVDTNGSNPQWIAEAISRNVVDFFAMDIKNPWETYHKAIGINYPIETLQESITLIKESGKSYQFRTTLIPGLSQEKMIALGKQMGISIVFQPYQEVSLLSRDKSVLSLGENPT